MSPISLEKQVMAFHSRLLFAGNTATYIETNPSLICYTAPLAIQTTQREGRDSNPRWTGAHNSFRDCPIQPLWHLPIKVLRVPAACGRNYILNFHARMQFRIINLMHILSFQFFCQCGGRQCFTMHKENFLHGIFDVYCILRQ